MEIKLELKYDELSEDGARLSDNVLRDVARRFPDAVWERCNAGWKIIT
jgi:hypothetical protein